MTSGEWSCNQLVELGHKRTERGRNSANEGIRESMRQTQGLHLSPHTLQAGMGRLWSGGWFGAVCDSHRVALVHIAVAPVKHDVAHNPIL